MRTLKVAVFLFSLFLLCGHVGVYAQTQTGTVSGTVTDSSGAAVPDAKIALKNSETGQTREVLANDQGVFYFDKVLPGNYILTITKGGFRTFQVANLEVFVGKGTDIGAAKMEVGSLSETVVVEAGAAPMMETQSAQITGTFSAKEVQTLRIGLGGLDNIALLTPGVTPGFGNINSNGVQVASNGQRSRSTQFMLDGHQMNDITIGGPSYFVNNFDMVAEYQVVTNQFSAEYGRNLGATVNIITKSGTNSFHGQAYWAHNNSALDAKTSLQTKNNIAKPKLINNVWGVNVGGPVLHDKLFFYFGYRGRKQPGSSTAIGTSSFEALTGNGVNTLLAAFPNSNPLKIYKAAGPFAIKDGNPQCVGTPALSTFAGVANVENCPVQRVVPSTLDYYEYDSKVDYVGKRHTFMGRYMIQNTTQCCTVSNDAGEDGYWVAVPNRNQSLGLTHTFQITPKQINYFRFAYGRFLVSFEGANTQPISNVQANLTNFSMPSGFLSFGLATNLPQNRLLNNFQFQDNWSLNWGRHFLKAGIEIQRNRTKLFFLPFINGSFAFVDRDPVTLQPLPTLQTFAQNRPDTVSFAAGNGSFSPFETDQFYYFQDDFRVKPNFTLNLGIRYENNGQPINRAADEILAREKDPAQAFWLQSVPLDQRTLPHQPNDNNNWSPRIGFAYTPRFAQWLFGQDKTVFRGGYGIAYELAFYNILLNMTTAAPRVFLFSLAGASTIPVPGNGLGSDVAGVIPVPRNTIDPRTLAQTRLSPNFHNPYSQSWSFGFQREILHTQVLEVRYVGTNGVGLFQSVNANPLFSRLAAASTVGGITLPGFPQFIPNGLTPCSTAGATGLGRVDCMRAAERDRVNGAHSVYHSLQTRYDVRNWKNQFSGGASYTWSRAIDNVSEIFNFFNSGSVAFSQSVFNTTTGERGVSNFDLTHTLVLHYIWELPWYRSQHGFLGRVLGGWQFSGTTTFYSGRPFTPIQRTGNRYCGQDSAFNNTFVGLQATCRPFLANASAPAVFTSGSTSTPNVGFVNSTGVIHRGSVTGTVVTANDVLLLFNDDNAVRFITNTPFGIGRNILRGPGTQNWDMAIDKRFRITERFNLKYRMSMINAFNHRIWDDPNPRVDLPQFGDFRQNNVGPNIQNSDHPLPGGRSIRMGLWVEF
jgi:hypothetical protein